MKMKNVLTQVEEQCGLDVSIDDWNLWGLQGRNSCHMSVKLVRTRTHFLSYVAVVVLLYRVQLSAPTNHIYIYIFLVTLYIISISIYIYKEKKSWRMMRDLSSQKVIVVLQLYFLRFFMHMLGEVDHVQISGIISLEFVLIYQIF